MFLSCIFEAVFIIALVCGSQHIHGHGLLWCSLNRAYGAVYKAVHKESGQLLAIKQVPVDSDLQDIIKEISIMQQCDR